MEKLGKITLIIVLFIYSVFATGFLFLKFYTWFILTIFNTLPVINYSESIGLMIFITCIIKAIPVKSEKEDDAEYYIKVIIAPWLLLGIGYLVFIGINI